MAPSWAATSAGSRKIPAPIVVLTMPAASAKTPIDRTRDDSDAGRSVRFSGWASVTGGQYFSFQLPVSSRQLPAGNWHMGTLERVYGHAHDEAFHPLDRAPSRDHGGGVDVRRDLRRRAVQSDPGRERQ